MELFRAFRKLCKIAAYSIIDRILHKLPIYYTNINKIPLSRYWELSKNNYKMLWKVDFINYLPNFFFQLSLDLTFQLDKIDLTLIRKKAEYVLLNAYAIRTNDNTKKFHAAQMLNEIRKCEIDRLKDNKIIEINEFVDYIEITFNCIGTINPDKISAGRAFSLYNKAIEKNKAKIKEIA